MSRTGDLDKAIMAASDQIAKQRNVLRDWTRAADDIRKPYRMKTREFARRVAIIKRNERRLMRALCERIGVDFDTHYPESHQ